MEEQALLEMRLAWPAVSPWWRIPAVDRRINDRCVLLDIPWCKGCTYSRTRPDGEMNALTRGKYQRRPTSRS